ncbi:MAG: helix-turn-helix domain-containing protein [Janthinobacterium lividum]
MERLLTVGEAAQALGGISKYTVQAWLSSGKLQRTKVGSRTMIRESDLQAVVQVGAKSERVKRIGDERVAA